LETDIAVVGAGPAGLSAAIEAAKAGARTALIDENDKPGGQLFKQIHKFFGHKENRAGIRGYVIGNQMLREVKKHSAHVLLDAAVYGIFQNEVLGIVLDTKKETPTAEELKARKTILATGASENALAFPGWTLPGVMGAGAVQTVVNVHRVLPGKRFLTIGSGNVGLVVSYQLLQAGAEVLAVLEAAPKIGGYGVHAAKLRRAGVPILVSHTIKKANGRNHVETATIVELDDKWRPVPNTENVIEADVICVAIGLEPRTRLARSAGCEFMYQESLGGMIPIHDDNMRTTERNYYVAGDAAGVEDACVAMEEGRLAGIAAAESLGFLQSHDAEETKVKIRQRLRSLRRGSFGKRRYIAKKKLTCTFLDDER
jgi:thioredoxin reductase